MKLSYNKEYYDDVIYNSDENAYELERQVGNQTIWMQFGLCWDESMSELSDGWFMTITYEINT